MAYTAAQLIALLALQPHAEGGWYAFLGRSGASVPADLLPGHFSGARDTCSLIYYMLQRGEISRWHQLQASEVWAWHQGGSLEMTLGGSGDAPAAGGTLHLGPRLELGERFHMIAPPGQWQTTRVVDGDFVLVSCVVSPSFCEEDCLLPAQPLPNEIYQ